jgi:Tol biopolymer transport system component
VFQTPVLVEGAGDDARFPSISGSELAYERFSRNFDIQRAEIVGPEGTASHRLQPSVPLIASTRRENGPSWSPDGRKIAFTSDRSGTPEVWICESDGSNPLKLTSLSAQNVLFPRWSPDGRLTFSATTGPDGNFESYVVDARGGPPERIHAPGHKSMVHTIFSHDGRWLYFIPGAKDGAVEAFRMPATGGEAVQITRSGKNGAFRPEEVDGRLYFAKIDSGRIGAGGLWSMPVTGGEERQILESVTTMNWTVTPKGIYYFDFAVPNGRKLVKFYSFQSGRLNDVGTVEATVSADFSGISVSPDGRWLLYSYVAGRTGDLMLLDHFR